MAKNDTGAVDGGMMVCVVGMFTVAPARLQPEQAMLAGAASAAETKRESTASEYIFSNESDWE